MTDLLIIVPARGKSKRLPRKNLRALAGRTLLERTQDAIEESGLDAPCLLTTDDEEIAEAGRRLDWLVPFLRPAELAHDSVPTTPAVLHALDWFAQSYGGDPVAVMVLQVTSPFRGGACLRRGIEMLAEVDSADAVVAVRKLPAQPGHIYLRDEPGLLIPVQEPQCQQALYVPNGALYLVRTPVLRALRTLSPPRTLGLVMGAVASIDIDTEEDWMLAEAVAGRLGPGRRE